MLRNGYRLQDEAGDGTGGGGAGDAAAQAAAKAAADATAQAAIDKAATDKGAADKVAADAAAAAAAQAKGKSLLEDIGKGGDGKGEDEAAKAAAAAAAAQTPEAKALAASEKDTRRPKEVPAKYWDAAKGEVNYGSWAKSTTELETRMRTFGLPPKAAEEYKFTMPEELKAAGVDLDPAMDKAFRAEALDMGLTQKQYERVVGNYFKHVATLADQTSQFSHASARADLLGYYKTEEKLKESVRGAYQVFSAFADERDMAMIDKLGNIPAVIRVLAKIAPEIAEDPGVNAQAILTEESLAQMMRGGPGKEDSPYWNPSDPRHASTLAKVMAHHEATAAATRRKAA